MEASVDPRLAAALAVQLERWRALVASGAERVGWKLGVGDRLITGSVVQVPVAPGDEVVADLGSLGRVGVTLSPDP